jgi:hypothetical protein
MGIELIDLLFIFIIGLAIWGSKAIGRAIEELARGGPRPPSHPLSGDDSKFLNRPRSREQKK